MADKFQRSMKWPGLDDTYYFLPLVSEADNGKVMIVEDGDWVVGSQQVSFDTSRLQVHDVSVTTSLWVDSTLHADYPYQALIPVNGATSEMCPDVVFDITEALSGNYAPVADAANGGVLIYAKVVPEADIVVPTVTLWK